MTKFVSFINKHVMNDKELHDLILNYVKASVDGDKVKEESLRHAIKQQAKRNYDQTDNIDSTDNP